MKNKSWDYLDELYLQNNYLTKPYKDIAIKLNRTLKSIMRKATSLGLRIKSKYSVNEKFFDAWSSDMAYILGFVLADGCVMLDEEKGRYQLQFCIHKDDIEILNYINKSLSSNYPIHYSKDMIKLHITSRYMVEKLVTYGIIPRKTGKETLPPNIPEEFLWDFIRGYFDGDGCITYRKSNNRLGQFFICCSSRKILDDLQSITNIGTVEDLTKYRKNKDNFYNWIARDKNTLKQIYSKMYNGNFCLNRKYKTYTEYISAINSPTYRKLKEASRKLVILSV